MSEQDDARQRVIRHAVSEELARPRSHVRLSGAELGLALPAAEGVALVVRDAALRLATEVGSPTQRTLWRLEEALIEAVREWTGYAELVDVAGGAGGDLNETAHCCELLASTPGFHSGACRHCDDVFGWCGDAKPAACPFCSHPDPIP